MSTTNATARPPEVGGCPFDPLSPDQLRDPRPWFAAARGSTPVFYLTEVDEWWVTRYDDCLTVLRDTDTFSSRNVVDFQPLPGLAERLPDGHPMSRPLVNTDPPEHSRLRRLAQRAFTPRAVADYEPTARALTDALIDGFAGAGRAELYGDFARPLTIQMICGILGIPPEKNEVCKRWIEDLEDTEAGSPPLPENGRREVVDRVVEFDRWIKEFIDERRANPRADLTSSMVSAVSEDGSPSLTTWEAERLVVNILSAGFETSASLIGELVFTLLRKREHWERIRANPELVPVAVEEILRAGNPVRGLRRYVTRDTTLAGVSMPEGSTVVISLASAMSDEEVFSDPETFSLDRPDVGAHFGFGKWTHFCLGAPLARMEAIVALERLIDRLPHLNLAEGEQLQDRQPHRIITAVRSLRVEW
jgi:cytochrome P450